MLNYSIFHCPPGDNGLRLFVERYADIMVTRRVGLKTTAQDTTGRTTGHFYYALLALVVGQLVIFNVLCYVLRNHNYTNNMF